MPTKPTELDGESDCEVDKGGTKEKERRLLPPHHPVGVAT